MSYSVAVKRSTWDEGTKTHRQDVLETLRYDSMDELKSGLPHHMIKYGGDSYAVDLNRNRSCRNIQKLDECVVSRHLHWCSEKLFKHISIYAIITRLNSIPPAGRYKVARYDQHKSGGVFVRNTLFMECHMTFDELRTKLNVLFMDAHYPNNMHKLDDYMDRLQMYSHAEHEIITMSEYYGICDNKIEKAMNFIEITPLQ